MGKPPPVFFFAFANDRASETRYLRNLADEENQVREALDKARRAGLCHYEPRFNATADKVWNVFNDPEFTGRIAVFHFAGHAGEKEIVLETPEGSTSEIFAGGLADFLGRQEGLQLVFLNGCSTAPQVQALLAAGVPAVIATERDIDDKIATKFSAHLYRCLAAGAPLSAAFEKAVAIVRAEIGENFESARRSFAPRRTGTVVDWPWKIHPSPEEKSRISNWKLGGGTGHTPKPEVTRILPYLCDRRPQEGRLDAAVNAHRTRLPRRPLAILVHGDSRQALDCFAESLQDPTLPRLLGRAPWRRIWPLTFKDPGGTDFAVRLGPLQRSFAEKLCGDRGADLSALANAVAAFKCPVMVDVDFTCGTAEPILKPELLTAWLGDLARWPDLPENQDLIFLLRFSYHETATASPLLFWKKSPSRRINDLISQVVSQPPPRFGVVALPALASIEEGDVYQWLDEHVGAVFGPLVRDRLKEKVLDLFRTSPSLFMNELGPKLYDHLRECLKEGGA